MEQPPLPQQGGYAAYPRNWATQYGSAERLEAVADGYFGLNKVFGINIVLVLGTNVALRTSFTWPLYFGAVLLIGLVIGFATYPQNKKIGFGCNWNPATVIIASVLMGLNSALCCGIIGYVVVQQVAANEMKKYGIKGGFGGIKKSLVQAKVQQMQMESAPPPISSPPPL